MAKSNTAILAECFAALTDTQKGRTQLDRLLWHVEHKAPILCRVDMWLGRTSEGLGATPAALANALAIQFLSFNYCYRARESWIATAEKFNKVNPWYPDALVNSTPSMVRSAIRRAAKVKGIGV